jgi:cobyrinic acid a,c-diamide synthase
MSDTGPRGLIVAAASSHSGKTLVTMGLIGALRRRGLSVAAAKCGPDYIDPKFLEAASGRTAVNLDPWAMAPERLRALAGGHAAGADILIVEGVMGLYDGGSDGAGSTASLAATLGLPVLVIVDGQGTAQTAAVVADGLARQARGFSVAGALVNRCGSGRHGALLREGFARTDVPLIGIVARSRGIAVPSRHLGLVQASEIGGLDGLVAEAAKLVEAGVDLDRMIALAAPVDQGGFSIPCYEAECRAAALPPPGHRIAVACDIAFAFAYPHMLQGWHAAGAKISFFSPLADEAPDPDADFIFLPGGYPELHAGRLAAAATFRAGMLSAAERGAAIYGECGGYMVSGDAIIDAEGARHAMLGLLPLVTSFAERRLHLGYRSLTPLPGAPWDLPLRAHEFHFASIVDEGAAERLFEAATGDGERLGAIGLRRGRVTGSFAHVIEAGS